MQLHVECRTFDRNCCLKFISNRASKFFFDFSWLYFGMYLGEKKRSICKNFFFRWIFGLEKTKNVIILKFVIGGSGGVQKFFWLYQKLTGEILTCFAPKSFSLAPRIGLFSFGHTRFISSTLPFLELQKNFLGKNRLEFQH